MIPCTKDDKIIIRDYFRSFGGEVGCMKVVDHIILEKIETYTLLSVGESIQKIINITDLKNHKLFLSICVPDWWEDDMEKALFTLYYRTNTIKSYIGTDSDYRDYILDKTKIINMQKQLNNEKQLIEMYKNS